MMIISILCVSYLLLVSIHSTAAEDVTYSTCSAVYSGCSGLQGNCNSNPCPYGGSPQFAYYSYLNGCEFQCTQTASTAKGQQYQLVYPMQSTSGTIIFPVGSSLRNTMFNALSFMYSGLRGKQSYSFRFDKVDSGEFVFMLQDANNVNSFLTFQTKNGNPYNQIYVDASTVSPGDVFTAAFNGNVNIVHRPPLNSPPYGRRLREEEGNQTAVTAENSRRLAANPTRGLQITFGS